MRALEIADRFRARFEADAAFAGKQCFLDQDSATFQRPCLVFDAQSRALNSSGTALLYTLAVSVESHAEKRQEADPDPEVAHAATVEAVRTKLLTSGKAALRAELNAGVGFDFRGWSAIESDGVLESSHFRTPITITGTVLVL